MTREALNNSILQCHDRGETGRLADLYAKAGTDAESQGNIEEACFHFTTAYVYALDTGKRVLAHELHAKLIQYGREE